MFNLEEIKERAETNSFKRGLELHLKGHVSNLSIDGRMVKATVVGQQKYQVSLVQNDGPILNHCTCPASQYQNFCKHCVAVALSVEGGIPENNSKTDNVKKASNSNNKNVKVEKDDKAERLLAFLKEKPAHELADLLMGYIENDKQEWKKWQLKLEIGQSNLSLGDIKKMITKALPLKSIWKYREVASYFDQAENLFEEIFQAINGQNIQTQWKLTLHAIERLNKALERVDDSGGYRFALENMLCEKLVTSFNQQDWTDELKAQWLLKHMHNSNLDLFPRVPEDFTPTQAVEQRLLELCHEELISLSQKRPKKQDDLFTWQWQLRSHAEPLIQQAINDNNWREQCHLLGITAHQNHDFIKISQICLDNNDPFDAEDWLIKAQKYSHTDVEKRQCGQHKIKVLIALDKNTEAWQTAWTLFTEKPSFRGFKSLKKLEQDIGQYETELSQKVEALLIKTSQPASSANKKVSFISPFLVDDILDFYLDQKKLTEARQWAKQHKVSHTSLIELANQIIGSHPTESVEFYHRVLKDIISRANNDAYQEATNLMIKLETLLTENHSEETLFQQLVQTITKESKQKRNLMALVKTHFAHCL